MKSTLPLLLLLLCSIGTANAESRYITDQFDITMRSGEGTDYRIISMLPSGDLAELLNSNPETGYSEIRSKNGETGYVLTHLLMKDPSARKRLAALEKQLKKLKEEPGKAAYEQAALQEAYRKLSLKHQSFQKARDKELNELEAIRRTTSNTIKISNERKKLHKQVAYLTRQMEELKQENLELSNDSSRNWFLIGAVVILLGIILGIILPNLHLRRRKSSWSTF